MTHECFSDIIFDDILNIYKTAVVYRRTFFSMTRTELEL